MRLKNEIAKQAKDDLRQALYNCVDDMVDEHLEYSKDRYRSSHINRVSHDLYVNYEHDAEIKSVSEWLGRSLNEDEKDIVEVFFNQSVLNKLLQNKIDSDREPKALKLDVLVNGKNVSLDEICEVLGTTKKKEFIYHGTDEYLADSTIDDIIKNLVSHYTHKIEGAIVCAEWCAECGYEVELPIKREWFSCPVCDERIALCNYYSHGDVHHNEKDEVIEVEDCICMDTTKEL